MKFLSPAFVVFLASVLVATTAALILLHAFYG